ncbi:MAG: ATP-binding region ATPase domain protein [Gemmatimonadetes bacterium]|jgi:signal transduction histidine kinase/PAS domain-containing protein|nr:ATP-binding region ATPase domain protein [Gemmatimonadota bacterium]
MDRLDSGPGRSTAERRRAAVMMTRELPALDTRLSEFVLGSRTTGRRYAAALAATAAAAVATVVLTLFVDRIIFVFFWPAVIFSALIGGMGPATLSSVLAVAFVDWFVLQRRGPPTVDDIVPLTIFLVSSLVVSSVATALRHSSSRHADATRELHELALELEEQATELEQQLEESQALQEEVEQTSAELAARTQEAEEAGAFSRGILASISDPFVVHDADWRFVFINAQAEEIFRNSVRAGDRGSLVGTVLWDAYPDIVGTEHERQMRRAAAERVPVTYEAYYAQAGTWSVMSCYPLPDGGLATQWRDITERRRGEERSRYLARASEVLGSSLDYEVTLRELAQLVVPELAEWCTVHMVEADGTVREVALAHADPGRIAWAAELNRRFPPDPDAAQGVPQVIRSGEPLLMPEIDDDLLARSARDDEHRRLLLDLGLRSAMVLPLASHGRTLGALSLLSGRTGRRYGPADLELALELARRAALAVDNALLHRAERRARIAADEANAAKMQFLAVMSHELRTPLNAIGGYAELMRIGLRGPVTDAQLQDLDRIMLSQRNLLGIINDILNFARIDAGHLEFRVEEVPVAPLLEEVEQLVAPQLLAGTIALVGVACDDGLTVRGDREKVRQILLNLLSNAIKFTAPGGTIAIQCTRDAGMARIDVRDSGIGIDAGRLHTVFEPFVQLDRTLTSQHEGTGLGLAISRDLARAMDGDLVATSEPGVGSVFTVILPLAAA